MLARLSLLSVFVVSVAVMVGVAYYFLEQLAEVERREEVVKNLDERATNEGPCEALTYVREIGPDISYELERAIEARRPDYAREVLSSRDRTAQNVFLSADAEGLIDRRLCEEVRLSASLGEPHPIMAMLRFSRSDIDPCEEAEQIGPILRGLTTHRKLMLGALLKEPSRLKCFEADVAERVARMAVDWLEDEPTALDRGDVVRTAAFLTDHAPVRAAQLGCRIDATGEVSRLANTLGCSENVRERVLLHYRYTHSLPGQGDAPALPAGSTMLLIGREGTRCNVRPLEGQARLASVSCADLELVSDVHVAVLVENIAYGRVRADMIAGVATYQGAQKSVSRAGDEPPATSWFAYDLDGDPLGTTQVVSLEELGKRLDENVPAYPIRTYCEKVGAKYCYDVDWTQVLKSVDGGPVLYLSRPLDIFLTRMDVPLDVEAGIVTEAFGHAPVDDAVYRIFELGADGMLAIEALSSAVELRWKGSKDESWRAESFGLGEGGGVPPSARLLAAMDLQQDGTPELLVQRVYRELAKGQVRDTSDEIVLMVLEPGSTKLQALNRLTVHEY